MAILKNARWERFCQEVAKGLSATAAYTEAGYRPSRANAAHLLRANVISQRVNELLAEREAIYGQSTAEAVERAALTKEWVIGRLVENVHRAMQAEAVKNAQGEASGEYRYDGAVANRALELLGKEVGMFIDRKEIRTGALDEVSPDELDRLREELVAERARRAAGGDGQAPSGKPN